MLLRGLICPAIFATTLILHARNPHRLPALLPAIWPVTADIRLQLKRRAAPVSLLASFRLGRLVQRLQTSSRDGLSQQDALSEARGLVDGDLSDVDELRDLEAHLEHLENRVTILSRIRGALSLVNFIWLVSIGGLGVTLWPTLQVLGGKFIAAASLWFMRNVFPSLLRLHRAGVFEALSYVACSFVVAQAARYLSTMGTGAPGSYIALTAFVMSMFAFRYTFNLHLQDSLLPQPLVSETEEFNYAKMDLHSVLWSSFQFAVLAPLAVVHKSELLGFCSIWSLLSTLGYFASTVPFGYVVGFTSEQAMDRVAVACALLIAAFVSARLLGSKISLSMKPFHLGVMVMGNLGYFLALLIRSSRYFEGGKKYVLSQIQMIVSLGLALGIGRVFGIDAMNNTATTFGALYLIEKISDLPFKEWAVVGWFGGFGLLYAAAAFLRTHPGYLRKLIDARGFLSPEE